MRFLERRRLEREISNRIAKGLDLLEAGEIIPEERWTKQEWLPPGNHGEVTLRVDLDRIERLAADRGVDTQEVLNAAALLGGRKAT